MSKIDDLLNNVRWCIERSRDPMIKSKLEDALAAATAPQAETSGKPPKPGSWWEHHNGGIYRVLCVVNQRSERPEYPATVVYEGSNRRRWARPLSDWYRSFRPALVKQEPLGLSATAAERLQSLLNVIPYPNTNVFLDGEAFQLLTDLHAHFAAADDMLKKGEGLCSG